LDTKTTQKDSYGIMTTTRSQRLVASAVALLATSLTTNAFAPAQQAGHSISRTSIRAETDPQTVTPREKVGNEVVESPVYFNILTREEQAPPQEQQQSELSNVALAASAKISNSYAINGWVPKDDYALWGLPGAIAPVGFFDPLGFARQGLPLNDAKRLREAEVHHGRVAMLAVVGYLSQEAMNTLGDGGPFHITGPANDQLQQVPAVPFAVLTLLIGAAEIYRAKKGWVEPQFKIGSKTLFTLRDDYYPGDLGFDPLGLKPTENYKFQRMQTKELSHGRLAMLAWAGMCAQELVNHRTIGETWSFYSTLFSGDDLSPFYN
jgi:Chlorophyll A-B binding protein